jgi:Tol biopolymer transport system component
MRVAASRWRHKSPTSITARKVARAQGEKPVSEEDADMQPHSTIGVTPLRTLFHCIRILSDAVLLMALIHGSVVAQAKPRTLLASSNAAGKVAGGAVGMASDTGLLVVFDSSSTNLVPNDTNGREDIFVKNLGTGGVRRVSVSSTGAQSKGASRRASISGDGTIVVFESDASNLVVRDTNGKTDVFVHELTTGKTIRVSVSSTGGQGNDDSTYPSLSSNGRFVGFRSKARNLIVGDTNGTYDAYVHDRITKKTFRVSVDSKGKEGLASSWQPFLTPDGRFAVFESSAPLVTNDTNGVHDVFVRDLVKGITRRVSVTGTGGQGLWGGQLSPHCRSAISDDGRFVAFTSISPNLVPKDSNKAGDAFVKDMRTGSIVRANVGPNGIQDNTTYNNQEMTGISRDGRFVVFNSKGSNLVKGDTNKQEDEFVRDLALQRTEIASVTTAGAIGNGGSGAPTVSPNGRFVAFHSNSTNLPGGAGFHVYLRDRGAIFAHNTNLGGACGGVGDVPYLTTSYPILGRAGFLGGEHVAPNTTGIVVLGLPVTPKLSLGGSCAIHVNPAAFVTLGRVTSNAQGRWTAPTGVPNLPGLVGGQVVLQAVFPGKGALGLDLSNAVLWTIGY